MRSRRVYIVAGTALIAVAISALGFYLSSARHTWRVTNVTRGYTDCVSLTTGEKNIGTCLRDLAKESGRHITVKDFETALSAMQRTGDLNWCHEFMHYAGWELYDRTADFSEAFASASGMCDSGMMHGVVEQYVSRSAQGYDPSSFALKVAPSTCESGLGKNNKSSGARGTCYHGLGHAFMFLTDNTLNSALEFCDYLGAGSARACFAGVFMEGIQTKQVGRSTEQTNIFSGDEDDPNRLCNSLDTKYKNACYSFRGTDFYIKSHGDIQSAFAHCKEVNPQYRNDCYYGIGEDIPSPSRPTETSAKLCAGALEVDSSAYEQCINGGVMFVIQMDRGKSNQAVVYCDSVEERYKNTCYASAGKYLGAWTTPDTTLAQLCSAFRSAEARTLCVRKHIDSE